MLSFFPFRFSKLFPEFSAQYHIPEIWSYIAFRVHPLEWFCATGFSVERNTLWTRVLHNRHLKETIPYLLIQYVCRSFREIATILRGLKWIMHLVLFIWRRFVKIPTRLATIEVIQIAHSYSIGLTKTIHQHRLMSQTMVILNCRHQAGIHKC